MTRKLTFTSREKATFRQVDIKRLVKGAIGGGWPVGAFNAAVENRP